jgi:hypothetical protein
MKFRLMLEDFTSEGFVIMMNWKLNEIQRPPNVMTKILNGELAVKTFHRKTADKPQDE